MTARAYLFDTADLDAMKKLLEYDPYLDTNILPKVPKEYDDPKYLQSHPEEAEKAKELIARADEAMRKLKADETANIIFARQDYLLKDGPALGFEPGKQCLYLNAADDFIDKAEKKLKDNIKSVVRLDAAAEAKVLESVSEERKKAESGLGFIFG